MAEILGKATDSAGVSYFFGISITFLIRLESFGHSPLMSRSTVHTYWTTWSIIQGLLFLTPKILSMITHRGPNRECSCVV